MPAMAILSVVIPAFNAEKYVGECIESVLRQPGYKGNVELLVVIDGATDGTESVVRRVAGNDDSVRVFVQERMGASASRNLGLAHVRTEYVTFLDADDSWSKDYLQVILPLLSEGPDLIEYDAELVSEDGRPQGTLKIASAPSGAGPIDIGPEEFLGIFRCYAWARVCRTDIASTHSFPDGRRFEDCATTPWYYWASRRTVSMGKALVAYRQHPASVLATPLPSDVAEICGAISESARMYGETNAWYWRLATYRIFHFACQRTSMLPLLAWPGSLRRARALVSGVPRPPGFRRWLQARATFAYVAILAVKRKLAWNRG